VAPGALMMTSQRRRMTMMTVKERKAYQEKREALKKLPFTPEEKIRWARMMHNTWQAIADDIEEGFRGIRQKLTRSIIVECVCDANRMMMYGDMTKEEDAFLSVVYHRPAFQRWARKEMNY
jgi:hypothetical protein